MIKELIKRFYTLLINLIQSYINRANNLSRIQSHTNTVAQFK